MMTKLIRIGIACAGLLPVLTGTSGASAQVYGQFKDPLPMIQRSVLNDPTDTTGVPEGKMGGIAYDPISQCMYFCAPRSGVLIVEDPLAMTRLQVVRDLNEPMGVAVAADLRKLVLTGGDGSVKVFKIEAAGANAKDEPAGRLTFEKSVSNPGEADQVRYDAKTKRAFYGHGKYLSWINPADGTKCPKSIELPGPTRGIVIEPGSDRMFVSIPSKGQILVIDRVKWTMIGAAPSADDSKKQVDAAQKAVDDARRTLENAQKALDDAKKNAETAAKPAEGAPAGGGDPVVATWQLKDADQNCPLALDDMAGKLFVACRNPTKLLVLDAKDGREIDRLDIGADAADCWWDPIGRRVYVSCGGNQGQISMIRQVGDKFTVEHQIDTAPGARTSVFVPEKRRYIVCAPKLGDYPTFVYIYVLPNVMEHNEAGPKSH